MSTRPPRSSPGDARADAAHTEAADTGRFLPIARVFQGQLGFVCRNDPVPSQGVVTGIAAPTVQQDLDRAAELTST